MRWKAISFVFLFIISCTLKGWTQAVESDSTIEQVALANAIADYHHFLYPETALYDGSEYPFRQYYPTTLSQGNPFFYSTTFDSGSISFKGVIYQRVPLLYDVIQQELLTNDPSGIYIIRLDNQWVDSFSLWGFHFVHIKQDGLIPSGLSSGYYEILYAGPTSVYCKVAKKIKENGASSVGINTYASNADIYFMKRGNKFYRVRNKKNLMEVFSGTKRDLSAFLRKEHLKIRKDLGPPLVAIARWVDSYMH